MNHESSKIARCTKMLVAACLLLMIAGNAGAAGNVTVSMSVWGMPWEDLVYTDILIPMFQKQNPNIKVEFQRFEDYWTKLVTLYSGGEAPDVMRNELGWVGQQLNVDMLMPLDDFIKGPDGIDMNQYVKGYYDLYSHLEHKYFIPIGVNNWTIISYNKELFDAAGVKYPSPTWTIEEFESTAKSLKKLTNKNVAPFFWEAAQNTIYSVAYGTGAKFWEGAKKDQFRNSAELAKAFQVMQKWVFDDKITPAGLGSGESRESALQLFQSGRLAMLSSGGWQIPALTFNSPNLKFATVPFPATAVKAPGGNATGTNYTMNKDAKHPQEAWKLIKFLTSETGIMKYWQHTYVETPASIPVRKSPEFRNIVGMKGNVLPIQDKKIFEDRLGVHLLIAEKGWFYNSNLGQYSSFVTSPLMAALDQTIGTRRGDAAAVAKAMVEEINRAIKNSQY